VFSIKYIDNIRSSATAGPIKSFGSEFQTVGPRIAFITLTNVMTAKKDGCSRNSGLLTVTMKYCFASTDYMCRTVLKKLIGLTIRFR